MTSPAQVGATQVGKWGGGQAEAEVEACSAVQKGTGMLGGGGGGARCRGRKCHVAIMDG
jgi:hypothetical protein